MEPRAAAQPSPAARSRAGAALRRRENWVQLGQFCAVGGIGYAVNLAVYTALVHGAGMHYIGAATLSFVVAVTNNYLLNRLWTFRREKGSAGRQGARFLVVSLLSLGANLLILRGLVAADLGKVPAQAVAIVLVTPLNFVGNKLWSFRRP
jgi:putative flippase GtrA